MTVKLATLERCAEICGLQPHEILIGASPVEKHRRMLARCRNLSPSSARARLVAAIRAALARQANERAADLLIVLRLFLALPAPVPPPATRRRRLSLRGSRFIWISSGAKPAAEAQERGAGDLVVALFDRNPSRR